jgi:endonuclease/exonuclease/phosphatase family metal-dependent hydrolase
MFKKTFRAVLAILLILALTLVAFYFWSSSSALNPESYSEIVDYDNPEPASHDTFKLMTFNIGWLSGMANNRPVERPIGLFEQNLNRCEKVLDSLQPDFVLFQEIDFDAHRSFHMNQMDSLAIYCGFAEGAYAVNWDNRYVPFPYWPVKYHFRKVVSGQAVLSRYKITGQKRILHHNTINKPFYYKAFYLNRLMQVVIVALDKNRQLALINLHLEPWDRVAMAAQAKEVAALYDSLSMKYPVIIAGDFNSQSRILNDTVTDPAMNVFLETLNLKSATIEAEQQINQGTYPSDSPKIKIDYILYDPEKIELLHGRVLHEMKQVSDHLPVMMEFVLVN